MSVVLTYASLIQDLQNYLQRQSSLIVEMIPTFVMLAQQRIPRETKLLGFRQEVIGNFDGTAQSTGIMQKPSDWRKTIAFYVGTGSTNSIHTPVFERDYDYIRTVFPDATVQDVPRYYADADYNHWLVQPSPPSALPYKIAYYSTLTMLDNTNQTNWLTQNAPDLLLYASLLEAVPFLKDDDRVVIWQGYYNAAKTALIAQDTGGLFDTQAIVSQPTPQSVLPR